MVKSVKKITDNDLSMFSYVLDSKKGHNNILNSVRDRLVDCLNSEQDKVSLQAINVLRQMEESHLKSVSIRQKTEAKTITNGDFYTIEDVVKRIKGSNGDE